MTRRDELLEFVRFAGHHRPAEGFLLAFAAYLDDSDDAQSSVITLAGYMARIDGWKRYEEHSARVYEKYGISDVLHSMKFNGTKTPFKGWRRAKKLTFLDELLAAAPLQWGIAISVDKKGFAASKGHTGIGPNMSAYGLAFAVILHTLVRGNPLGGNVQAEGLSIIVETGHRNNGDLERVFAYSRKHEMYSDVLRTLTFTDKKDAKALHLADMLAFHARRHHALKRSHPSILVPEGPVLTKLRSKVPHTMKITGVGALTQLQDYTAGDSQWLPVPLSSRLS